MEGGLEQESESSPISIFSPLSLQILHTLRKLIGLLCQSFWVFFVEKKRSFSCGLVVHIYTKLWGMLVTSF